MMIGPSTTSATGKTPEPPAASWICWAAIRATNSVNSGDSQPIIPQLSASGNHSRKTRPRLTARGVASGTLAVLE